MTEIIELFLPLFGCLALLVCLPLGTALGVRFVFEDEIAKCVKKYFGGVEEVKKLRDKIDSQNTLMRDATEAITSLTKERDCLQEIVDVVEKGMADGFDMEAIREQVEYLKKNHR
jgi:hypothetical protein